MLECYVRSSLTTQHSHHTTLLALLTDSPSHNGLSVDCPAPHHPNCSNGTQDTPTPSCMNLLPRPQETTPRTLQASEIVSLHDLRPMEYEHDQSSRMEMDIGQENGQSNKIDLSGHLSGVVNGQREHSGSELEHNATINQEVDYNRLCDSIYTTVNYCHFFWSQNQHPIVFLFIARGSKYLVT